jgi:cation diffusion facilitator CzcD-associated flavoprotein CzcO
MQVYDVIIIGGGISGLYSAFQIKKMAPKTSILILEKNDEIGGRMDIYDFYNIRGNFASKRT